ncbi:MAG: 50S ribosomal protein L35 [Candidatus Coatesbacteria bacterium]|nr:50S ribosomal protein L35 [Candidatus Coatesbacteria bacterium]
MPKLKTSSAAKKRFKLSGTGLIIRSHANKGHILTKKTRKRKNNLGKHALVSPADHKNIARILPYL